MKKAWIFLMTFTVLQLTGCAHSELEAPCPDYGRYCKRSPINSWDYYDNRSTK